MTTATLSRQKMFNGDKKNLIHFLAPYEKIFLNKVLPHVPLQVNTAQLTLMTILWSTGIVIAGSLSSGNIHWLWLFSGCILMQYITDMLDGEVGRHRKSGLIKWGFYMDHFLDYIFLCSIIIGYSFLLPASYHLLTLLCMTFSAGFMVHFFMDFAITNNFKISCNQFGVSEMRWVLILFNTALIFWGRLLLIQIFPFFVAVAFMGLCFLVYSSQRVYQHIDAIQQGRVETNY